MLENDSNTVAPDTDRVTWRDLRLELRALRNELRLLLVVGIFANTILAGLHLPEILTGSAVVAYIGRVMWVKRH